MDIEADRRKELIHSLGDEFLCEEEVGLFHPIFRTLKVRADVLAIPTDERFWGCLLAFEVKEPKDWNYAKWCKAIHQATDYVYATVEDNERLGHFTQRRVAASFVYPSPPYAPYDGSGKTCNLIRDRDIKIVSGAFSLAARFRVGRAIQSNIKCGDGMMLSFGPNLIWESGKGFTAAAEKLLTNKRPVGSKNVDVFQELDGIGAEIKFPEFE